MAKTKAAMQRHTIVSFFDVNAAGCPEWLAVHVNGELEANWAEVRKRARAAHDKCAKALEANNVFGADLQQDEIISALVWAAANRGVAP